MNNLETQATLDTKHETKKNKRRRKQCDIDYMSVLINNVQIISAIFLKTSSDLFLINME
jgi:hypothetical protein